MFFKHLLWQQGWHLQPVWLGGGWWQHQGKDLKSGLGEGLRTVLGVDFKTVPGVDFKAVHVLQLVRG